jgi:hypothetical protein
MDETMTRDEHREECFEEMKAAAARQVGDLGVLGDVWWTEILTAAFDSLHGIARVVPVEATEEMLEERRDVYTEYDARGIWRDMSAVGDLTNPPEGKP